MAPLLAVAQDIDGSHATGSESIRTIREQREFRSPIRPTEEDDGVGVLDIVYTPFDPGTFEAGRRAAMKHNRDSESALGYVLPDVEYQQTAVLLVPDGEARHIPRGFPSSTRSVATVFRAPPVSTTCRRCVSSRDLPVVSDRQGRKYLLQPESFAGSDRHQPNHRPCDVLVATPATPESPRSQGSLSERHDSYIYPR